MSNGSLKIAISAFFLSMLVACGGRESGSAGTAAVVSTTTPVLLDSFGQPVSANDGFTETDAGVDGTVSDGVPQSNTLVTVLDASGKTAIATTDTRGYYRAKVTGFISPLIAFVVKADGTKRYSLSTQAPVAGKFATMNISGLTDKIASDVAVAGGKSRASELTPTLVKSNAAVIDTSIASIKLTLALAIQNSGVSSVSFDPLKVPYLSNDSGYDYVLDNTIITYSSNGATLISQSTSLTTQTVVAGIDKYSGSWVSNCLTNAGDTTQSGTYKMTYTKSSGNVLSVTTSASVYVGAACAGTASPSKSFATTTATLTYVDTATDGRDRFVGQSSTTAKVALKVVGNLLYTYDELTVKDADGYPSNVTGGGIYFVRQ